MKLLCFSKKSNLFRLLCVIFACFSITSQAQVTIGANDDPEKGVYLDLNPKGVVHGGLLLPNVYITNMDSIPVNFIGSFTPAERDNYPNLKGMVVYNTNTSLAGGSGEGVYVWDGYKWSVNDGKSSIFTSTCSPASNVAFQGGSISCTVTDPDCTTGGVYSFNLISGSEYAQLRIDNAGTGSFTITFDANNRASERSVVLMVTSPCGRGQVFFYTQDGDINGCNASASAPKIMADKNPVTLCSGGAVYLYLNGNPSGNYIWTLNGNEIGTGTKLVAVSAGKYIVYANKVGCTFFKPDTMNITASSSVAPEKIPVIIAENNGLVCTQTSTVKLTAIATIPSGSQIVWYKDGVRTTTTGLNYNNAGLGEYFAVVEDGNCMSKPSNPVVVQVDPNANAGTINVPNFTINGTPDGSMSSICSGSMLNLKVSSPQPSVTYTWYHNNTSIGQGESITYSISGATGSFVLRCQATGAGCSQEKSVQLLVSVGSLPDRPYITVSNPGNALCGGSAQLTANVSGTASYTYIWYYSSDGSSYSQMTEQTQSITIDKLGYYKVAVNGGSCVSEFSGEKHIAVSSAVTFSSIDGPVTVNSGETKTYFAILDNPQVATYEWSIGFYNTDPNVATIVGSKNSSSVVIAFKNPNSSKDSVQIKLNAYNACGAAINNGVGDYHKVIINAGATSCTGPLVSPNNNITALIVKVKKGQTLSLSVNGDGSPVLKYQWYKNSVAINNATTNIFVKNNVTASDAGDYECWVTSTCNNMTAKSRTFRVEVEDDPAQLPLGEGSLSGRTCFDIAETANGADCGSLSVRSSSKANFAGLPESDKTYTFTATTTNVSNVRFVVIDNEKCVESTSSTQPLGTNSLSKGSSVRLTVNYKTTLNRADSDPKIQGRSRSQAAVVMIYAVYFNGSTDVAVPLKVTIQDCMCCGAMVAQNVWKAFMCHNLGAEQSADPFTPSYATNGAYYQWGRKEMAASAPNSQGNDATTITWNQTVPSGYYGNGSNDVNATVKSAYDPCPAGFRVPSYNEFQGLINNNTKSYVGSWTTAGCSTCWAGVKFGDGLMLPAAGLRDGTGTYAGQVRNRGKFGGYWSSTKSSGYRDAAFRLYMEQGGIKMDNGSSGNINGTSVRCIAE